MWDITMTLWNIVLIAILGGVLLAIAIIILVLIFASIYDIAGLIVKKNKKNTEDNEDE